MYLEHFGLEVYPFGTSPDPRFFYPSAKHKEALACLIYAVEQRKGFALITGEVGAGKSMLCRAAFAEFGDHVLTALVTHTSLSPKQFFQAVCAEFNIPYRNRSKIELIHAIKALLENQRNQQRNVVLIVDEAQNLSIAVLEEVRMLGNLEAAHEKLIQIILVGQPELRQAIGTQELRQLNQRLAVKFHLGALSLQDVAAYVDHRVRIAGRDSDISLFDDDAKRKLYDYTQGVPRLVNVTCDQALLQAYVSDHPRVTFEIMRQVVSETEGYYMDAPPSQRDAGMRVH
jgi:general secretion pathway protein A